MPEMVPGFARAEAERLMAKARDICSLYDATRQELLRLELVLTRSAGAPMPTPVSLTGS